MIFLREGLLKSGRQLCGSDGLCSKLCTERSGSGDKSVDDEPFVPFGQSQDVCFQFRAYSLICTRFVSRNRMIRCEFG